MRIILTCGHAVDSLDAGYTLMTKAADRNGEKAVSHRLVCADCHSGYKAQGQTFETEAQAQKWLLEKSW